MSAKEILRSRLQALLGQLDQLKPALDSEKLDPYLRRRMSAILRSEMDQQRRRVDDNLCAVQKQAVTETSWTDLRDREREAKRLFKECLDYLQAARSRGVEINSKLCEVADQLLDELSDACELGWRRFTILAQDEKFSDWMQIIRLRFPLCGVWDLPVAAHEFGHFAAFRLTCPGPNGAREQEFRKYVLEFAKQSKAPIWEFYLNEFFADIFATYVLGPSYACTSLLLRFQIADAYRYGERHPSYASRAWAILFALQTMNQEPDSKGDFTDWIDYLSAEWASALRSGGTQGGLPEEEQSRVNSIADRIYDMLSRGFGEARYANWATARKLQHNLKPDAPLLTHRPGIRDLLNAAWLARSSSAAASSPEAVSERMLSFC